MEELNISRETIRKIIELTTHEFDNNVWGDDYPIGTMDKLIDRAIEIIKDNK